MRNTFSSGFMLLIASFYVVFFFIKWLYDSFVFLYM